VTLPEARELLTCSPPDGRDPGRHLVVLARYRYDERPAPSRMKSGKFRLIMVKRNLKTTLFLDLPKFAG
jgi:hypothetical protein